MIVGGGGRGVVHYRPIRASGMTGAHYNYMLHLSSHEQDLTCEARPGLGRDRRL